MNEVTIIIILISFTIASLKIEKMLALKWIKWYYRFGIPLIIKEYDLNVDNKLNYTKLLNRIKTRFHKLSYKNVTENEVFFLIDTYQSVGPNEIRVSNWRGCIIKNVSDRKIKIILFISLHTVLSNAVVIYVIIKILSPLSPMLMITLLLIMVIMNLNTLIKLNSAIRSDKIHNK